MPRLLGKVYCSHAAATQYAFQPVPISKCALQTANLDLLSRHYADRRTRVLIAHTMKLERQIDIVQITDTLRKNVMGKLRLDQEKGKPSAFKVTRYRLAVKRRLSRPALRRIDAKRALWRTGSNDRSMKGIPSTRI